MGQTVRLRSGEYEILDAGEVLRFTAAGQLGPTLDPLTAISLLQGAAREPAAMRSLRIALAGRLGTRGGWRRSDRQVLAEFTRLLRSAQFTLRRKFPEGNAGRFIVVLVRTRVNNKSNPTIISLSEWQVVKTVPGTWLTAVAKYGLKWPRRELHRVYSDEWVQKCEPVDPNRDTEPKYTFWEVFAPGGMWEKGVAQPSREPKPGELRDRHVEIGSYWCFKIREVAEFKLPEMDTELLKRRKKLFDLLFEQALAKDDKKELLGRLSKLEQTAKAIGKSLKNETAKREELKKLLEQVRQELKRKSAKKDVGQALEAWFQFALRSLDKSVGYKESMEGRVVKEIDYLKFRCAEYDTLHESDQQVKRVQKGTSEEPQWKKTPVHPPTGPSRRAPPPPSLPGPARSVSSVPSV